MKLETNLPSGTGPLHLAPMLDVVTLLVIFFLIGGTFVLHSGVAVDVPVSNSVLQVDPQAHVITVSPRTNAGLRITFNGQLLTMTELQEALKLGRPNSRQVIIRGDRQAYLDDAIRILSMAKSFGYEVALSTDAEEPQ